MEIDRSKTIANWLGSEVEGLSVRSDDRIRLAAALISLSLAHHSGVVHLYDSQRWASALALVRSMIDAFVRSQWIFHLASYDAIKGFVGGDRPPDTLAMIDSLEGQGFFNGLLSSVVKPIWPIVCDFNHGGGRIVVRHFKEGSIEPNFSDGELIEVLIAANAWAMVSAAALGDLTGDRAFSDRLLEQAKTL